jgi:hypothetical protein
MKVAEVFAEPFARVLIPCIAMKKMAASNILIVGVPGLGVEIGTCFPLTPKYGHILTAVCS